MSGIKRAVAAQVVICMLLCAFAGVLLPRAAADTPSPAPGEDNSIMDVQAESYDQPISRETFCYLAVTLFAQQQGTTVDDLYGRLTDHQKTESFQDIKDEDKYISLAKKYTLMEGTGGTSFAPTTAITRAEIARILYNLTACLVPEWLEAKRPGWAMPKIEDSVELADWSREAVEFCVGQGLMKLDQHSNFDPTATMTVADATMLISDMKVFLESPIPSTGSGIPVFVWFILAGCVLVGALVTLIILLRRRSNEKSREKVERERQQEDALDKLIAPSVATESARGLPPTTVLAADPEEETVYLRTEKPPKIRFMGAEATGVTFDLFKPITIGRGKDCVLKLTDSTISRNHCQIRWHAFSVVLEDTGARNPTQVVRGNQTLPVAKGKGIALKSGDIIRLGASELTIHFF